MEGDGEGRGNAGQELIAKIFVEKEDGPGCFRERKLVEVIKRALLTRLLMQPLEFSAGS